MDKLFDRLWAPYGPTEVHRPDYNRYPGRAAPQIRNQLMVDLGADLVIAFIRNNSPGASGCLQMALTADIRAIVWRDNGKGPYREVL